MMHLCFVLRYLAESNCSTRFCRPLPNRSAKVPKLHCGCKGNGFILSDQIFLLVFGATCVNYLLFTILFAVISHHFLFYATSFATLAFVAGGLECIENTQCNIPYGANKNNEYNYVLNHFLMKYFLYSDSKLGVKTPFPMFPSISFADQNRPPSSSSGLGCISPSYVVLWTKTISRSFLLSKM